MRAKVYGISGSHPVKAALGMLELKGIAYDRIDLPPVADRPFLRALGFPGPTVPAIRIDGRKLQTTRAISRDLDELVPDPPLFPSDPERRAAVEEAERWGDELLQPVPRRLSYAVFRRDRAGLASLIERPVLGLPPKLAAATSGPVMAAGARLNKVTDASTRADLAALPGLLDHVDALIADGTIGGEQPNAADFQIAASVRLLTTFDDLRPALEARPAADHAMGLIPHFPGRIPPALPAEWLAPLRRASAAR